MSPNPLLRPLVLAVFALGLPSAAALDGPRGRESRPPERAAVRASFLESLPLSFEENRGQGEKGAAYLGRASGWSLAVSPDGAEFVLGPGTSDRVRMRVRGAREGARLEAVDTLPTKSNYFLGNDPSRWITGVPHAAGLRARDVVPGVSLRWRGVARGKVRYDFEVDPYVEASSITVDLEGAESVRTTGDGSLEVRTAKGVLRHSAPVAWQEGAQARELLPCRFDVRGTAVRFSVEGRNSALPLVIDPTVEVAANLGTNPTRAHGCALDSSGGVLVAGNIRYDGYGTPGAYQRNLGGYDDAFVARYAPGSSFVDWFTYLGGQFDDRCWGLALDSTDAVYVVGSTQSGNFPKKNAVQGTLGGTLDGFVSKLSTAGDALEYSTFLGGADQDSAEGIAIGEDGRAWVVGWSNSDDFTLVDAVDSSWSSYEGFITCLSPSGNGLLSSTYMGGTAGEILWDVALAEDGTVWVGGYTASTDFPTMSPVQESNAGGPSDAALIGLSSDGKTLLFASYFGGSNQDESYAVDVDMDGNPIFAGYTASSDFPTQSPYQGSHGGGLPDAVVFKVDASSKALTFSTYLGGSMEDVANALVVDRDGTLLVSGSTRSSDFPTVDAIDSTYAAGNDIFLSRLSADGSSLLFSTYLGGTTDEATNKMDSNGSVVALGGYAYDPSTNGPDARIVSVRFAQDPFRSFHVEAVRGDAVELAWEDPYDGVHSAEVQRRVPGGAFATIASLSAGTTEYEDIDVVESADYLYRVRGTSAGGDTGWSKTLFVHNGILSPGNVTATSVENDSVGFTWVDRAASEIGYAILRRPAGATGEFTVVTQLPPGSTSGSDTTVDPETSYEFRVRAQGPGGLDGDSVAIPIRTPPATPSAFGVLALDDASVQLTWSDESSAETGYEVQRRDDGAGGAFATVSTGPPGLEAYLDEGVASEHAYTWRVRAFNADGGSRWTNAVSLTTPPAAPTGLLASAPSAEAVDVTWTDASQAEFLYRIERKGPGQLGFSAHGQVPANQTSFRDDRVLQKASYSYRVRAASSWGASRALETVEIETPAQLVILKAAHRPARGDRPARISTTGRLDPGEEGVDWNAGGQVRIGGTAFDVPAWTFTKGAYGFETDGFRVRVKPAKSGASELLLAVAAEGTAAEAVGPDGRLDLEVVLGGFQAVGNAMLSEGRFDPAKGRGRWVTPSLTVTSMSAATPPGKPHRVKIAAAFAPPENPLELLSDVRITIGPSFQAVLDSNAFVSRKGKFVLHTESGPIWDAVLDPVRGTLKVRGANIGLGAIPEGTFPFRIELDVGEYRYADDPVVVSTGTSLKY